MCAVRSLIQIIKQSKNSTHVYHKIHRLLVIFIRYIDGICFRLKMVRKTTSVHSTHYAQYSYMDMQHTGK